MPLVRVVALKKVQVGDDKKSPGDELVIEHKDALRLVKAGEACFLTDYRPELIETKEEKPKATQRQTRTKGKRRTAANVSKPKSEAVSTHAS